MELASLETRRSPLAQARLKRQLPLRGLPGGRYVLVHRVNPGRRLRESDYSNNAASVLLRLSRPAGELRVRVIRRCPDAPGCG